MNRGGVPRVERIVEWVPRGVSFEPPELCQVRNRPRPMATPSPLRRTLPHHGTLLLPVSLFLFLFILPFSFARLSSFPPVDPANVLGVPSRPPPSRYYGNFEPIRKSIATAAGKSAETACVAGAPRERRASQAWLFQRLRKCNVFYSLYPFCFGR